jgi:uncharacterized protein involved in exopolysaccharide biosynthesis
MTERRDFDLASVLAELRRRAWLIFLCTFLSAGLAFGLSQLLDERYEATADLLFVETNPNAPERTAATNLALASLDAVMVPTCSPRRSSPCAASGRRKRSSARSTR